MTWLEFAWKSTVVLGGVFAVNGMLRRSSAALRHFVWSLGFLALLALPLATAALPKWSLWPARVPEAAAAPPAERTMTSVVSGAPAAPVRPPIAVLPLVWALGCSLTAARIFTGVLRTSAMVRKARDADRAQDLANELSVGFARQARVLASPGVPIPLAWGIFRPVIVLPADAVQWPEERLRTALLHELVHIWRLDLPAQTIAQAACCLYWFHPLVWMAVRQLRKERERACDDAVLLRGVAAHEYAAHLMDLVRGLSSRRVPWAGAPAMAEASDLEVRVRALLDRNTKRYPLRRQMAAAVAAAAVAFLLPLAAVTAYAQATRGALAGVVTDPSGARVPRCQITAKNTGGSNQEVTYTDAAGEYRFAAIPPGTYGLEFRAPGFAAGKTSAQVQSGGVTRADFTLDLGAATENVTIAGGKLPATEVVEPGRIPQKVRVGGNVQPLKLVKMVQPLYPDEVKQLGIQGTVLIRAVVSITGELRNPEIINTDVDARLSKAAMAAVSQWRYQPSLLNGEPVETATTITLDFQLSQ